MKTLRYRNNHLALLLTFVLPVVVLLATGCGAPAVTSNEGLPNKNTPHYPLTIMDDAGREVTFTEMPSRVITIVPSATEILFSIGIGGRIVATDENSDYPEEATKLPKIGGLYDVDMEKITELSPDLVITVNDADLLQNLENTGFTVFVQDPQTVEQIMQTIRELGRVFNVEDKADEVAHVMQGRIDAVTSKVANIPEGQKATVFYEVWDDPLMTAGLGSFISDVIRLAGGINIGDAVSEPWPQFSLEAVVDENPSVIVTPFKDTYDALMHGQRKTWQSIEAVKDARVLLIDQDLISRPSLRLVQALEQIAEFLYPDRFQ